MCRVAVLCLLLLVAAPIARAQELVALAIGNSTYEYDTTLDNPGNDVDAMAVALDRLGFDVTVAKDLSFRETGRAIAAFRRKARGADTALIFYAGHGQEIAGRNYLIPTDAELREPADAAFQAVPLETLQEAVAGAERLQLVIFDACRNNNFLPEDRSGTRGMRRPVPSSRQVVAFSTKPGTTAADGRGDLSPYTQALIERIERFPSMDVRQLFPSESLALRVAELAEGAQTPYAEIAPLPDGVVALTPTGFAPPPPDERPSRSQILAAQEQLAALGFDVGRPDGVAGARTEAAVRAFQDRLGLDATGALDVATRQALAGAAAFRAGVSPGSSPSAGASSLGDADDRRAGETFRDCPECPEMIAIPAGSFLMGSPESEPGRSDAEGPQRTVQVPRFAAGVYEVTFDEWDACAADGYCRAVPSGAADDNDTDRGWGRGRRPVIEISWNDIHGESSDGKSGFLAWLQQKTGYDYRLLSEAEWEYAARAGTRTAYWTGSSISEEQANFGRNVGKTSPAGSFPPNDFGLYDVRGNVWEWVQDCWNGSYASAPTNGSAWMSGDCYNAVLRGGSWNLLPLSLRSANRSRLPRHLRLDVVGFRVARTLPTR